MTKKLYEESNIEAIADAIREKNGLNETYRVSEMADAIRAIQMIHKNKNYVENGYFGPGVINQRGQTSWIGSSKYVVDRWLSTGTVGDTTLTEVTAAGIKSTGTSSNTYSGFRQIIRPSLPAGTYTFSVLIQSIESGGVTIRASNPSGDAIITASTTEAGLLTMAVDAPDGIGIVQIRGRIYRSTFTALAAKLELGDTQTLAHNEGTEENPVWVLNELPDPALELLKCQRYFQIFRTQALRPTYGLDFRPVMATDEPVLDSFVRDDVTYYTASSEP